MRNRKKEKAPNTVAQSREIGRLDVLRHGPYLVSVIYAEYIAIHNDREPTTLSTRLTIECPIRNWALELFSVSCAF